MAESSGNGLVKGYIYLMVVLAAGAGLAAYYLNSVHTESRTVLLSQAPVAVRDAINATEYLAPSVDEYFKLREAGSISTVDKSEFDRTEELMEALTREVGLTAMDNGVTITSGSGGRTTATRDKNAPIRHSVTVKINSCTKVQWQRVLELARQRFGSYAVLESFKFEPATRVNENKDLESAMDDVNFKYRVNLEYVWYTAAPPASAPAPTTTPKA